MSDTIRHDTVRHVYVMFLVIINDIRHMCKHMYSNVRKELNMGVISEKKLSFVGRNKTFKLKHSNLMKKKPASVDKYNRNNGHMCNLMSDDKTTAIVKVNTEYVKYKSNISI